MISYIDAHKDQFGTWAICRVLKQADRGFITSRGYRKGSSGVEAPPSTPDAPTTRAISDWDDAEMEALTDDYVALIYERLRDVR